MKQLLKLYIINLLLSIFIYASSSNYIPISVGDITIFIPANNQNLVKPTVSLGNDETIEQGDNLTLDATVSNNVNIVSYEWKEKDKTLGTGKTFVASNW